MILRCSRLIFANSRGKHYNHIANQNKAENARQYRKWIESHTPTAIHEANKARAILRRRGAAFAGQSKKLQDDREVKGLRTSYNYFYIERLNSGDFAGIRVVDAAKRTGQEWKAMSASEKKVSCKSVRSTVLSQFTDNGCTAVSRSSKQRSSALRARNQNCLQ